ncbi:unnamed protein product, partial [marine sediment metagenome]
DEQISLIKADIARARAEDRVVVYLSCPISSRGGGYSVTNVDIAKHTQRRLLADWGHRFWILNPAQYQLESKEGTGLITQHAEKLKISKTELTRLQKAHPPEGGDYMRMWTKVLVEDEEKDSRHLGRNFDAFYFLGPSDVRDFFTSGGALTVTAGIEEYFARKFTMDPDFHRFYSTRGSKWETQRKHFFRFYSVRASANFSLGCHDEWNIFRLINQARLDASKKDTPPEGDTGELLSGFFDGRQITPGAAVCEVSGGYTIS